MHVSDSLTKAFLAFAISWAIQRVEANCISVCTYVPTNMIYVLGRFVKKQRTVVSQKWDAIC